MHLVENTSHSGTAETLTKLYIEYRKLSSTEKKLCNEDEKLHSRDK